MELSLQRALPPLNASDRLGTANGYSFCMAIYMASAIE